MHGSEDGRVRCSTEKCARTWVAEAVQHQPGRLLCVCQRSTTFPRRRTCVRTLPFSEIRLARPLKTSFPSGHTADRETLSTDQNPGKILAIVERDLYDFLECCSDCPKSLFRSTHIIVREVSKPASVWTR